jgi:murein DD-endopeptidase MepM/ murein hydrolase activator NlpD
MALPIIGAAAGVGRVGLASALGGLAKDAVVGAGKGFVGGLKGAMMTEAPGLTGAYAFGKELRNRANAPRASDNKALSSGGSSNQFSNSAMGGSLSAGISTVAGQQKQSNVINLEQVRQLRQLNNNVINQSKLIAFQVNEAKRKELFAEELANEQALRDDKLLEAIRNIGGGGRGGAANNNGSQEGSGGGFLSGLVGSLAGGAGQAALTKLVPFLSATMAALPWARILRLATPLGVAASLSSSTPNKETQQKQNKFYSDKAIQEAQKRAAEEAKDEARPSDFKPVGNNPNTSFNQTGKTNTQIKQQDWDKRNKGKRDPVTGKLLSGVMNIPASGRVSSVYTDSPGTERESTTPGMSKTHKGVDIAMITGTPVFSISPGKVIGIDREGGVPDAQGRKKGLGRYVVVDHGQGLISKYAHLSEVSVAVGSEVGPGVLLGKSGGNTEDSGSGASTGAHLHLETMQGGAHVNPASLPGLAALKTEKNEVQLGAAAGLPGTGNSTGTTGATPEAAARRRAAAQKAQAATVDPTAITNYDGKFLIREATKSEGGAGPVVSRGLGGGGEGGNNSLYALNYKGPGGTGLRFKEKAILVEDETVRKAIERVNKALGADKSGTILPSKKAEEKAIQSNLLKPLFKSNTDIIRDANTQFIKSFRATATNAFTQILTKTLFPKGVGVSAGQAGRDDMYRGQQLQKIFGTDAKINSMSSKLLGKQYGPMFAPMFNNLAQGYLEVGSRVAGKAIFQGIGGLGAEETQTITGQVLGNYAAGNKKLALEQLLYGASGGKESGIALGAETMFAKYGFKNPMEGISYFANVLGEAATSPLNSMMNNNPTASVVFDPRLGYNVYQDGPNRGQRAGPQAGQSYGQNFGGGQLFSPGLNNYGVQPNPYGTTAMTGPPGSYITNATGVAGKLPTQAEYFGQTQQQFANNSKETLALQQAQLDLTKANNIEQARKDAEKIKQAAELSNKQIQVSIDASRDASAVAELQAQQAANLTQAQTSADALITKAQTGELISGLGGREGSGTGLVQRDANGNVINPNGKGNLFSNETGLGQFGNFAGDMLKNAAGQKIVQSMGIKNPYMQMVANFGIQKLLGKGFDMVAGSDFVKNLFSSGAPELLGDASGYLPDAVVEGGSSFFGDIISWFTGADGGPVVGPGTGRSDSIPALLSNGEFVVNAAASKKYRPLLDALNYTKYADGTPSISGSGNALFKATGVDRQLNALGDQTDLLTSIDGSLRVISGTGTSSGTGLSFDTGLAGIYGSGGTRMSGGGNTVNGVARSRATQQKPSAIDYATAIGGALLKSYAIKTGVNAASTAIFGSTPAQMAGTALYDAGFTTLGTMVGGPGVAGANLVTGEAVSGAYAASTAGAAVTQSAAVTEAVLVADTLGGAAAAGSFGASVAAAIPYVFVAIAAIYVLDQVYGGGDDEPPPKEPKYHAGIYVAGNNNINAIAPILVTTDYHAPPEVYKTVAYGLLRVAFNATKSSEAVTKMTASYDFIYMKVQYDKISMIVGKGAPNTSYTQDGATDTLSWPAATEGTNLNALAQDIINWVRDDFKKLAKAENLGKLDKAAEGLGTYTLDELSSGLIPDLKRGQFALDKSIEKGIYANSVAESNRIAQLITAASSNKAYTTTATSDEFDNDGNRTVEGTAGGVPMIYSLKDGKFIKNTFPGALLIDTAGRPVYDIEGTSAGLSVDDFVSASVAGSTRLANVLDTTSSSDGATSNIVVGPTKTTVDNSAVTNYYTPTNGIIDIIRAPTAQVGFG